MSLQEILQHYTNQITDAVLQLSDNEFTGVIKPLGNATVGQHVRHIIELFEELQNGYDSGMVCYDNRKRDFALETDKLLVIERLHQMGITAARADKALVLKCSYSTEDGDDLSVNSNYKRELIYNIEHTVHHMALLRVGIEYISNVQIPRDFGIAVSTLRHKKVCAQ